MTLRTLCTTALVLTMSAAVGGCADMRLGRGNPPTAPQTVTNPQWAKKPTAAEIQALYPAEARRMNVAGTATVQCVIQQEGGLRPCSIVSETPTKMGFGEAALKAASMFQIAMLGSDGRPLRGSSVTFPINFEPGAA